MTRHGLFHVSLAAKCRILFGLAVALIISAAIFVPWLSLENFIHDRNLQRAKQMAGLAYARLDLGSTDWDRQQTLIQQWWTDNAVLLKLPSAQLRLIRLDTVENIFLLDAGTLERWQTSVRNVQKWGNLILLGMPVPPDLKLPLVVGQVLLPDRPTSLTGRFLLHLFPVGSTSQLALDKFQREALKDLRANEKDEGVTRTEREPGRPTTYRYALAVRHKEPGSDRSHLVGIIDVKLPLPRTDETLLWTRVLIILAGLLAGFLAILVFYLITQKLILAPVRELRSLADQITAGDLTARASLDTGDEFEELSDAFNNMLGELERSRLELETINRSLDTRLGELAETNVSLFESNRLKSEFLANVSHELRTPLTSIIGFADLLRDTTLSNGPIDTSRAARYANNILTSGRMLLDIINDLLDLAKIEAGKVELHRSAFTLHDLCEGLADFMRPLVDKKNLTLHVELDEHLPLMNSDPGKLRQVLYNLLSNAVKYTQEGGTVELRAQGIDKQNVRLIVADNGPGISAEDQARVFEKFRQLDASVTREHSGTGLGLPISRELCNILGGSLRVESELGRGATFIVEVPTEAPEGVQRALPSLT
jgi:signal transduction histidine kinase